MKGNEIFVAAPSVSARIRHQRHNELAVGGQCVHELRVDGHPPDEHDSPSPNPERIEPRHDAQGAIGCACVDKGSATGGSRQQRRQIGLEAIELVAEMSRAQDSAR